MYLSKAIETNKIELYQSTKQNHIPDLVEVLSILIIICIWDRHYQNNTLGFLFFFSLFYKFSKCFKLWLILQRVYFFIVRNFLHSTSYKPQYFTLSSLDLPSISGKVMNPGSQLSYFVGVGFQFVLFWNID